MEIGSKREKTGTGWKALESDPETITKLAYKLGLSKKWCFTEIYGLEEELLEMLPKPAISLILLFPNKDDDDNEKLKTIYKSAATIEEENTSKVFFLRQVETLGYACGTIAMIHSIGNNQERSIVGTTRIPISLSSL